MNRFQRYAKQFSLSALALLLFGLGLPLKASAEEWVYTVRPGDSLWRIANTYLISPEYWSKVKELNNIDEARHLPPGTRLRIPVEWLKQKSVSATVVNFRGSVHLIRDGQEQKLNAHQTIKQGDSLRTGKNSSARIQFSDGSTILVLPNSEIKLEKLEAQPDQALSKTVVKLIDGRVENQVKKQSGGSRYEITTPAAVAAVRGTNFRVAADNSGETMRSEVLEGKVGVTGEGVTQLVGAGYATMAKVGSPPSAPRQLPAAPDLAGLSKRTAADHITFQWPAQTGIESYRAQLALDGGFARMVSEQVVETPQVSWSGLTPASYYMRVRAIDDMGFEGFNAMHDFVVTEPLRAPAAITPHDGAVVSDSPFFAWSKIADAHTYLLQIAMDDSFARDVIKYDSLVNNNFRPPSLAPGTYYWRVQSISRHGETSAFSASRSFTIEPK